MNTSDLVDLIVTETGLAKGDARQIVDLVFARIGDAAARGEEIALNNFGKFMTKKTPARDGRHPRTGERMTIKATTRIAFKPGKALKDKLNTRV